MLSKQELYPYSVPIDRETVVRSGALTGLPVRIHRHDDLADAGALCLNRDWATIMKDGQERKSNGSPCFAGNWGSFIWPESLPNRLGLLCYLLDVGCFHDDACEEMSIAAAHAEHLDLDAAMDVHDTRSLSSDSRSAKTKELVSTAILESIQIDRVGAMRMLEAYRKKWLAIMETYDTDQINDLDEYFFTRANNGGMGGYYAMLEFSLGIVVTDDEYELMAGPIKHVERCMLLTNDYWSWPREREQARTQEAGKVFNTVWFLMKQEPCSEEEAKLKVAQMVREEEDRWVQAKGDFYQKFPRVRSDLVKFLENLHTALAGNDYWSAQCYRHNDWNHTPQQPAAGHAEVHQLASLGRAVMGNTQSERDPTDGSLDPPKVDLLSFLDKTPERKSDSSSSVDLESLMIRSKASESQSPPPSDLATSISEDLDPCTSELDVLTGPIEYIQSLPSRGFRITLVDCLNKWLEVPQRETDAIKKVINSLHDSSLILDDIEDGTPLRRGFPSTHMVYGTGQSINSATYLYVQAVQAIHELGNPRLMDVLLSQLAKLFAGQSLDLYWTFHRRCPTEADYLDMIDKKTGALLLMIVNLMTAASPSAKASERFARFARLVGHFFQVRDDYMNITSADYSDRKGFCEDLDEQKFSYMMIYTFQQSPKNRDRIQGIFKAMKENQTSSLEMKKYVVSQLESSGSLKATKELLLSWQTSITEEIEALEKIFETRNPTLHLLIETLRVE